MKLIWILVHPAGLLAGSLNLLFCPTASADSGNWSIGYLNIAFRNKRAKNRVLKPVFMPKIPALTWLRNELNVNKEDCN